MSQSRWDLIQEVFHAAVTLPGEEQRRYVASRNLDPAIEADVLSMLEVDLSTGPLERLPRELPPERSSLQAGDIVGSYRLIQPIHKGGMGVVYLAERSDKQYEQRVAIKFMRGELALFGLERRFRAERQILANLVHPLIARLLDGGVTQAGQAYLVMEYVDGSPITEASKGASLDAKLRLFVKVCEAVQFAHQNLVVHRDLKPGNILVNAQGEPRLLDFGIAKLLDAPADETETVARAFTPRYASPEQVLGQPVSTLTDVYSLGVLLYEMLTGVLPYDIEPLESARLLQAIAEQEPRRPGSRIHGLPADLDYIVLKALGKEPTQRYGSVSDLARDIENHLDGRPVAAGPPAISYRAGKFALRHKTGVAAAILVLCAIGAGIGATLWQARAANRERDKAQAVSKFLVNLIQSGGPDREKFQAKGLDLKVVDLLDDSAQTLDKSFASQPDTAIEMRHALAVSYLGLGAWEKAGKQADLALQLARRRFGERNQITANMYHTQGEVLFKQSNFRAAVSSYRNALNTYAAVAPADPTRFTIQKDLSSSELNMGLREEALRDTEAALDGYRKLPGHDVDVALTLCDLAVVYGQLERFDLQDQAGKESIATLRGLADPPLNLAVCLNNRALFLQDRGRLPEALEAAEEAVRLTRRRVGGDYIELAGMLSAQSEILRALHRIGEAKARMDEALAVALKNYPRDHEWPQYILYMYGKMQCDPAFHEYEEGARKLGEALPKRRPNFPPDDGQISAMTFSLGRCLVQLNRKPEAEPLLREAVQIRLKRFGPEAAATKRALDLYRDVLAARGVKLNPSEARVEAAKK